MSEAATHIAGDWGTTHLRLHLCRGSETLDRCEGPGIGALPAPAGTVLLELIAPWARQHGRLPVWLAGMVGSRNGWREVPYVPCPAGADALSHGVLRFVAEGHEIALAPGASCTNPHGAPDVMRGEETQILGALATSPMLASGRHVFALPGTHTKWVLVEDGRISEFQTSLSGELYALLIERSTLVRAALAGDPVVAAAERASFELGLQRARQFANVPLAHLLFEVRSRQLVHGMSQPDAVAFLSGLIIGQDVLGALPLFNNALSSTATVPLIGAPRLTALYSAALEAHGISTLSLDATALTITGLNTLATRSTNGEHHALAR